MTELYNLQGVEVFILKKATRKMKLKRNLAVIQSKLTGDTAIVEKRFLKKIGEWK